jgi:two-component system chemotaxis response regulator CheY
MRALIVDDSQAMRNIIKGGLKGMGIFEFVEEAENSIEALKKMGGEGLFHIVFLDWYMPDMEGYECLLKIRQNPMCNDTKIMMVTTENQQENVIRAVMAGATEYLMKPFSIDMLEEKVWMVLDL